MEVLHIQNKDIFVHVCPERGGMITSILFSGKQLLYQGMMEETFDDFSKSVKGGIPYMFPNAGPLDNREQEKLGYQLPQHGIARRSSWQLLHHSNSFISLLYVSSLDSKMKFPFDFEVLQEIEIRKHDIVITHKITNIGEERLPISTGLHPYFDIPNGEKTSVQFLFEGGDILQSEVGNWGNDGVNYFDSPEGKIDIAIPELGTIEITVSKDYKKFWLWSLPRKSFLCVEPVMNNEGGLLDSPLYIEPGKTNINSMKLKLK